MKTVLSNASYEEYLKDQLMMLSSNFSLKSYKLACQEEWMGFERGRDVRIQIQWKGKCIWEWVIEKGFWLQRNTNKEDRIYMRKHADIKFNACKNAIVKNKKKTITRKSPKTFIELGHTQDCFEKMKK